MDHPPAAAAPATAPAFDQAAPATPPAGDQAAPDGAAPDGAATGQARQLLSLLRRLIAYGQELVSTLRRQPFGPPTFEFALPFGTINVALILARVMRGLAIAAALEDRLVRNARRLDRRPARAAAETPRRSPRATPRPAPEDAAANPLAAPDAALLLRLPTPEEIAARIRRRPIGAVLVDVARDLGIVASHPLWRELQHAVLRHRGDFMRLIKVMFRRVRLTNFVPPDTPLLPPILRPSAALPALASAGPSHPP